MTVDLRTPTFTEELHVFVFDKLKQQRYLEPVAFPNTAVPPKLESLHRFSFQMWVNLLTMFFCPHSHFPQARLEFPDAPETVVAEEKTTLDPM